MEFLLPFMTDKLNEFYYDSDSGEPNENSCEQSENMETENAEQTDATNKKYVLCGYVRVPSTSDTSTLPVMQQNTSVSEGESVLKQGLEFPRVEQVQTITRENVNKNYQLSDHLYLFFMSMFELTRKMPPSFQHRVKNSIFQTVSQVEGELLLMNDAHGQLLYNSSYSSVNTTDQLSPETLVCYDNESVDVKPPGPVIIDSGI